MIAFLVLLFAPVGGEGGPRRTFRHNATTAFRIAAGQNSKYHPRPPDLPHSIHGNVARFVFLENAKKASLHVDLIAASDPQEEVAAIFSLNSATVICLAIRIAKCGDN